MNPGIGTGAPERRSVLGRWVRSSIGAKWVMAVTGLLFFVWLFLHLGGNLMVFGGAEEFNKYAAFLQNEPLLLWPMRVGLLIIVVLHVLAGVRLSSLNRQARGPQGYEGYRYREASIFSRTMIYTGLLVLAFIVFHLLQFTILPDAASRENIHALVLDVFSKPIFVAIYVVAMVLVGAHLSHGLWSGIQTLGLNGKRWTPFALQLSKILAIALALGFISIPLGILIFF